MNEHLQLALYSENKIIYYYCDFFQICLTKAN